MKNEKTLNHIYEYMNYCFLSLLVFFTIVPNENKVIVVVISILWLLDQLLCNFKLIKENFWINNKKIFFSMLVVLFLGTIAKFLLNVNVSIVTLAGVCFIALIYIYYDKIKDKKSINVIFATGIVAIILTSLITLNALHKNEHICRILSTTSGNLNANNTFGIASYSHIYAFTFIEILLGFIIIKTKNNIKTKASLILLFILILTVILLARFVISYIWLFLGFLLMLFKVNNIKKLIIFTLCVSCITFLLLPIIQYVCTECANRVSSYILKSRFSEIATIIKEKNVNNTEDMKIRLSVYEKSAKIFLESPLFGQLVKRNQQSNSEPGGHSAFLDALANFGIVGIIPFILFFKFLIDEIEKSLNKQRKCKDIYFVILTITILQAVLNNIVLVPIACMIFTIIPSFMKKYLYEETQDENSLDS